MDKKKDTSGMCKNEKERKCFVLVEPHVHVLQKETYYFGKGPLTVYKRERRIRCLGEILE